PIDAPASETKTMIYRDGSPLNEGPHSMLVHASGEGCVVHTVRFELMRAHQMTPRSLTQNTKGDKWSLVWADEFDGRGLPDQSKWTHDLGNWGWGNREPQYYTEGRVENARQEGGKLIIEARPDDQGQPWTSARLTTRGKISFLYGRIEIRAKVPAVDGTWAAGWTLGDGYRDEVSWPYCGEIDICEGVGREIDDETGDGINHASCHTRAFYFKQGNHISKQMRVEKMSEAFHDYVCEWDETGVRMYLDGEHYYTYDKTSNQLEWPFNKPQNLILNLAMGGGMGGAIAPDAEAQRFEVDFVRVFEKR
ncbi:MAG: beta-glucanase (GH16 family), partial [Planctomycetota bacterium]